MAKKWNNLLQEIPMQYPVNLAGFEGRNLVVETSAWSTPKLLIDGHLAPSGPKRNQYAIKPNNSPHEVLVELKTKFPDPIPVVMANGNEHRIAEPLGPFATIWAMIPLVLIFVGGAIGGLLGGLAAAVNLQAMRSDLPITARYAISGIFSFSAFIIWLTIAMSIQGTLNPSSTQANAPAPPEMLTANGAAPGTISSGSLVPNAVPTLSATPAPGFGATGGAIQ
jgi:hypothetical protein